MQAPPPSPVQLAVDRTRCGCGTETLVFHPEAWYHGQESRVLTPPCTGCGKALVEITVPQGARTEAYALALAPRSLAARVEDGAALVDEIDEAREKEELDDVAEPLEAPLDPSRWSEPHEAPAAYATWKAAQPGPAAWIDAETKREAAISMAVVVAYVLLCIVV